MIWPRIVIAVFLLALPVWSGATGRSLWSLPVQIGVFTLAYIDGKSRIWRNNFVESALADRAKAVLGALLTQSVLVAILFFTAAGAASAFGVSTYRAPFDRLDAGLASAALAMCLLGGALARWAEGGRDPVDRALEELGRSFDPEDGSAPPAAGPATMPPGPPPIDPDRIAELLEEVDAIERRTLAAEHEIHRLASAIALSTEPLPAMRALADIATPGPNDGAGAPGEAHRRRIGLLGLSESHRRMDRARGGETREFAHADALAYAEQELRRLSELAALDNLAFLGSDLVRLEALRLARRAGLSGDLLRAALRAIADSVEPVAVGAPAEATEQRGRLRREAGELLAGLEAP